MVENNNQYGWFPKVTRWTKLGLATGGIAARVAGSKLGFSFDTKAHAEQLTKLLGTLKGPAIKAAQILAMVPDLLPPEYAEKLAELQAHAPPMGWSFVQRRMTGELGVDWRNHFNEFSETACNAASLGQVHQAKDRDGQLLACKLQYPDMKSVVDADLQQLKLILGLFEKLDGTIDTQEAWVELQQRLYEELDYQREAKHITLYNYLLKSVQQVHVPQVVSSLSTPRLLTMTWLPGTTIKNFFKDVERQQLLQPVAKNLFMAWYKPFYHYGVLHGDPHPGNYTIRPNGDLNLLDYGCIRVFTPTFVEAVIDLYQALQANDTDKAAAAYEKWGFHNLSRELVTILNKWAHFVYGPILEDRDRLLSDHMDGGAYTRDLAIAIRQQLRQHGTVKLPQSFVLMDRAALGLGSIFIYLRVRTNWYKLFNELIDGFSVEQLAFKQNQAMAFAGLNLK